MPTHKEAMRLLQVLNGPICLIGRLIYGTAMRPSEVLRLRLQDLDFANNEILIRSPSRKHEHARRVPMPKALRNELYQVSEMSFESPDYLFVSRLTHQRHLTPEAVQSAFRLACAKMKFRRVTPSCLRHAAAREIERRGGQISDIQKLLGHRDVNVTMSYLGAGSGGKPKVVSPLD